ncbi:hypothetical protein ACEU6E_02485 [Halorutilales archaeon Cl-col2-1]
MSLSIGSSVSGGIRRIANRNGALFVVVYALVGVIWQVTVNSFMMSMMRERGAEMTGDTFAVTVDLPLSILGVAGVVMFILLGYLSILATRTFVGGHTDSIPSEYYSRNIGWALINIFVGGVAYGILVVVGSFLLLIPGIIAYVAFVFMVPYIAVEDDSFVTALKKSWNLTRGHWLRLFVVLLIIFGAGIVAGGISSLIALATGTQIIGTAISMAVSVVSLGIIAEAFVQLRSGSASAS